MWTGKEKVPLSATSTCREETQTVMFRPCASRSSEILLPTLPSRMSWETEKYWSILSKKSYNSSYQAGESGCRLSKSLKSLSLLTGYLLICRLNSDRLPTSRLNKYNSTARKRSQTPDRLQKSVYLSSESLIRPRGRPQVTLSASRGTSRTLTMPLKRTSLSLKKPKETHSYR